MCVCEHLDQTLSLCGCEHLDQTLSLCGCEHLDQLFNVFWYNLFEFKLTALKEIENFNISLD